MRHARAFLPAFALGLCLAAAPAQSEQLSKGLVSLTKDLLGSIDDSDYASIKDPAKRAKLEDTIRKARIKNFASEIPSAKVDLGPLAAPFGLDPEKADHRQTLEAVMAANDDAARRAAARVALQKAGRPDSAAAADQALQDYASAAADAFKDLQTQYRIKTGDDGEELGIDWVPATGDMTLTADLGDEMGDVVLHGATSAKVSEDGTVAFQATPDPEPVTEVTPEQRARTARLVFGTWIDQDGNSWIIRDSENPDAAPENDTERKRARIEELQSQINEARRTQIHVWVAPGGGEVIQEGRLKRLDEPFRYDRERSQAALAEKIAPLQSELDQLKSELAPAPVDQHDPLREQGRQVERRPITVEVIQKNGYRFVYDRAYFDGERVTARRTLRDVRDIDDLPQWVINGIIANYQAPEWIELKTTYDPRRKSVKLGGTWWRLKVTYSPTWQTISGIHTPWNRPLSFQWRGSGATVRLVDLDGAAVDVLRHNEPFRVEVEFEEAPDEVKDVVLKIDNFPDQTVYLSPKDDDGELNFKIYRSRVLYARSRQYVNRPDSEGLYNKKEYVPDTMLEAERRDWQHDTQKSDTAVAKYFAGEWNVAHKFEDGKTYIGFAQVAKDGKKASLALAGEGGLLLYETQEVRASDSGDFLLLNFERVRKLSAGSPDSSGRKPHREGQVLYMPTLTRTARFTYDRDRLPVGVDLTPAPEERLDVHMSKRAEGKLAGSADIRKVDGDIGRQGQQSWTRELKIQGAVTVEDQTDSTPPTRAFYPFGRNKDRGSSTKRKVFIWGEGLPATYGDAVIIKSMTDGITYDRPRFKNEIEPDDLKIAVKKAEIEDPDSVDMLMVEASFTKDSEPGLALLSVNGAPGAWLLSFADSVGRAYFVDTPPIDGIPTDIAMDVDIVHLEVMLETELDLEDPLTFEITHPAGSKTAVELTLLDDEAARQGAKKRIWRSPPIHLYRGDLGTASRPPPAPDAIPINVAPINSTDNEAGVTFTAKQQKDPRAFVPGETKLTAYGALDSMGEHWRSALERAKSCYGANSPERANQDVTGYSRFILTELGSRNVQFKLGDHAAALLIRDEFVAASREAMDSYRALRANEEKLKKFLALGRSSNGASDAFWKAGRFQYDDKEIAAEDLLDLDDLAIAIGKSRDEAEQVHLNLIRRAMNTYIHDIVVSVRRAIGAKNCDLAELLVLAGYRAPTIVARILPRLMKPEISGGQRYWVPDTEARGYVTSLYVVGNDLRALKKYAAIDDAYKAMALAATGAVAAFGLSAAGFLGAAAYANAAADIIDAAYYGTKGIVDYYEAEEYYDYARGAAATYGTAIYEDAKAGRQSATWAAVGLVLPGYGAFSSLRELRHLSKINRGLQVAKQLDTLTEASVSGLTQAQRTDLLAYLEWAQEARALRTTRNAVRGASSLGEAAAGIAERGANAVRRTGARALTEDDLRFLGQYEEMGRAKAARIEAGGEIAQKLDDVTVDEISKLSAADQARLADYYDDIVRRRTMLETGAFEGRLRIPSDREIEFARRYGGLGDELAEAGDGARGPRPVRGGGEGERPVDDDVLNPPEPPVRGPDDGDAPRPPRGEDGDAPKPETPPRGQDPPEQPPKKPGDVEDETPTRPNPPRDGSDGNAGPKPPRDTGADAGPAPRPQPPRDTPSTARSRRAPRRLTETGPQR